jgi:hypothetical protein
MGAVMISKKILASAILVLSLGGAAAHAEVPDGTKLSPALVGKLMGWVEQATGYHAPTQPVVMASEEKFQLVMKMKGVHYADARAMYIPGMVILNNTTWEEEDPIQISLLVHELVHHAQLFSKRKYACADAKEYEAYTIQNKWLEQNGQHPFASQMWIDEMSHCRDSDS